MLLKGRDLIIFIYCFSIMNHVNGEYLVFNNLRTISGFSLFIFCELFIKRKINDSFCTTLLFIGDPKETVFLGDTLLLEEIGTKSKCYVATVREITFGR